MDECVGLWTVSRGAEAGHKWGLDSLQDRRRRAWGARPLWGQSQGREPFSLTTLVLEGDASLPTNP